MNRLIVIICATLLLASCQSYRWLGVDACYPGKIVFPSEVKTIMVLNNAAQQPDAVGHRSLNSMDENSATSISVDSVAYDFCKTLGESIAESPLFDDVRLCEDTLRWDSLCFIAEPFTVDEVRTLCDNYNVDALVSLDMLFVTTVQYKKYWGMLRVDMAGEVRVHWPGQTETYVLPFLDSLSYANSGFYIDGIAEGRYFEFKEAGIRHLAKNTARKVHENIVPHWKQDERWYYTSISSAWKQASVLAAVGKWEEAFEKWEPVYQTAKKWKRKAQLASNLALCCEMMGDFDKAVAYAKIAYGLYVNHTDTENMFTQMQADYLNILTKRKAQDKDLSKQLNESIN